jgi:3-oxoisoapionate decarboxylase
MSRPISMHVHSFTMRFHLRHEPGFDVFRFIEWAAHEGFTGVNISANGPGFRDLGGVDDAHFAAVRAHLRTHDMRCEIDTSDTRLENMERMVRVAALVGADRLRTYTRYRGTLAELIEWTVADLRAIAPVAADHGIVVVLENHEDFQGAAIAQILGRVDHPNVRALYDYGNSQMVGEEPFDALRAMLPFVATVHMKDHVLVRDREGTVVQGVPMGSGRLPIIEQTELLYAGGLRRFCFENVWAYVAPVTVDPATLPTTPPFELDHDHVRLDGDLLPHTDAIAGEAEAFRTAWEWLRTELLRAGFGIEREQGDTATDDQRSEILNRSPSDSP